MRLISKKPCGVRGVDVEANINRQDVRRPSILRKELLQQYHDIVIAANEDRSAMTDVLIRAAVSELYMTFTNSFKDSLLHKVAIVVYLGLFSISPKVL